MQPRVASNAAQDVSAIPAGGLNEQCYFGFRRSIWFAPQHVEIVAPSPRLVEGDDDFRLPLGV